MPDVIDFFMGSSNGRWDGNTLVVEVTNNNDQTWFDRAGNHHSDAMRLIERYTPIGPDHLQYEVTVTDPKDVQPAVEDEHAALSTDRARA